MRSVRSNLVAVVVLMLTVISVSAKNVTFPADSVKGPMCVVIDSVHGVAMPLSPAHSTYNTIITDGLAQVSVTQMFVNDYGKISDMIYVFPLPHEAAVHAMSMEYKGMLYTAEIYEKEQAKAKYDSVVESGGNAALLLQDRPNVFQQRLANIAFHDTAWVKIELSMPLAYDNGTYEFAMPTMVAERFRSEDASEVGSGGGRWNPPEDRGGQSLDINVLVQTGFQIESLQSPTHAVATTEAQSARQELTERSVLREGTDISQEYATAVFLEDAVTYPNRDFVLRFGRSADAMDFTVASYYDTALSTGYFYTNIFPADSLFSGDRPLLDIVILIDISGSQNGWPLIKEKEVANTIIGNLAPQDRFTVLSFNGGVSWCFGETSVAATAENVEKATTFINGLSAAGGTNLLTGVNAALAIDAGEAYSRFFVFLSDGFITNEDAIFSAIRQHPSAPTVFTFGAGNNLNRYFLDEAAKIGNGVSTELTDNENVQEAVLRVWDKIESPQLTDISIACDGLDEEQLLMSSTMLFKGVPVPVYGVYDKGGEKTVTITGTRNGEEVTLSKEITLADGPNAAMTIPRIWAKQMIRILRIEEGTGTSNKNHIIELSKQYQVLSDYTAFLAINPVEVTGDNSISGNYTGTVIDKTASRAEIVTIRQTTRMLEIELAEGTALLELALFDLKGRCMLRVPVSLRMNCHRFMWDQLLPKGGKLARGHYVLKLRTTQGLITRHLFLT